MSAVASPDAAPTPVCAGPSPPEGTSPRAAPRPAPGPQPGWARTATTPGCRPAWLARPARPARCLSPTLDVEPSFAELCRPNSAQGVYGALCRAVLPQPPPSPGVTHPPSGALAPWQPVGPARPTPRRPVQLREVALPVLPGEQQTFGYLVSARADGVALRVSPPRIGGSSAEVRWGLDAAGRPLAVHTSRFRHDWTDWWSLARLERLAYAALNPEVAPRREFVGRGGRRVLAMPLWDTDLFTLLDVLPGGEARALVGRKLLRDLAGDYVRLHARGIVHNDCKPENVLVRADGTFALTDVDCAFVERRGTPAAWRWARMATPGYPAPEPLLRPSAATCAVDIFRFGLCLLSFYGAYDYSTFTDDDHQPRNQLEGYLRATQNLALLRRLRAARTEGAPSDPFDSRLQARYGALSRLTARLSRLDPGVHALVLDRMLAEVAGERWSAPKLRAAAEALLPRGGLEEARACAYVAAACAALPEVAEQRRDLAWLASLPARPAQA